MEQPTRPMATDQPLHLGPFVLDPPECTVEWHGRQDFYLPDDDSDRPEPRPAVVLVHGGPVPAHWLPTPRDWPVFVGYARALAAAGIIGVPVDHRFHSPGDLSIAAEDVTTAVGLVRADARVDPDRIALWFFSGGGLLAADWLARPPFWLRCVALTYPMLAPPPQAQVESRFQPIAALAGAGALPIVLTRVGRERAQLAAPVEEFLAAAAAHRSRLALVDVPDGQHGFDFLDHTDHSRWAVQEALRLVRSTLV
jgi:acetyl esterase/lipase